jgi:hypothetical protein
MQDLIDYTDTNTRGHITPAMEEQLIKIKLDFGEHCQHWSSVQRTLFSVLSQAVSNISVLDNMDSSNGFPTKVTNNNVEAILSLFQT